MARRYSRIWWLPFALALPGCASMTSLLAERFSREHSCQKDVVMVREAGGNEYVAEGCGQRARYICGGFAAPPGSEQSCVERGVHPNASGEPPAAPERFDREPPPK